MEGIGPGVWNSTGLQGLPEDLHKICWSEGESTREMEGWGARVRREQSQHESVGRDWAVRHRRWEPVYWDNHRVTW